MKQIIRNTGVFSSYKVTVLFRRHANLLFYAAICGSAGLFLALAVYVHYAPLNFLDLHFSHEMQEYQNNFKTRFMTAVSWPGKIGVSATLVVGTSLYFLYRQGRKDALLIISTLLAGIISLSSKVLIGRPRPSRKLVNVLEMAHSQSFPSGHVLFYTAFLGAVTLVVVRHTKVIALKFFAPFMCILLLVLGGISRIYLGAHWFTDVVGGFLSGSLYLLIAGKVYFKK